MSMSMSMSMLHTERYRIGGRLCGEGAASARHVIRGVGHCICRM